MEIVGNEIEIDFARMRGPEVHRRAALRRSPNPACISLDTARASARSDLSRGQMALAGNVSARYSMIASVGDDEIAIDQHRHSPGGRLGPIASRQPSPES